MPQRTHGEREQGALVVIARDAVDAYDMTGTTLMHETPFTVGQRLHRHRLHAAAASGGAVAGRVEQELCAAMAALQPRHARVVGLFGSGHEEYRLQPRQIGSAFAPAAA